MTSDDDYCAALVRGRDLDRYLAILYAPADLRPALFALHALDLELDEVARTTTEPLLGQIRITWWREALEQLEGEQHPPAHPILRAMAARTWDFARLDQLAEHWFALIEDAETGIVEVIAARGRVLFELTFDGLKGNDEPSLRQAVRDAGEGWALADAFRSRRQSALAEASATHIEAAHMAYPRVTPRLRPLFALAGLAKRNLRHPDERRGSLVRQLLLLRHIVTGRQ